MKNKHFAFTLMHTYSNNTSNSVVHFKCFSKFLNSY